MDFQRLLLLAVFSVSTLMLWENWQVYQQPHRAPQTISSQPVNSTMEVSKPPVDSAIDPVITSDATGRSITVKTDTLLVEINTIGGDIGRVELLKHKDVDDSTKPFVLLRQDKNSIYTTQSGLIGTNLPNHKTIYAADQTTYELADKAKTLEIQLTSQSDRAKITKTLIFNRNSNLINVKYGVENISTNPIATSAYFQLLRDGNPPVGESKMVPTYSGPAIFTDAEKFQKVQFSTLEKDNHNFSKQTNDGWVAMLQHYFVSAWLPAGSQQRELYAKKVANNLYSVGVVLPIPEILPGQKSEITMPLYVGPASADLDKVAPGLGLTVDYGWLTVIASPLFVVLSFIQGWVHNWGIAIIVLTVLIKLVFFPLSAASYRSMAKMRLVAPKLEKIKQQYSEDRDGLNRAMMELYKTEKINPLGGCLPVLVQIPVFISLYWAILSSVELRHAPFFGWISDLSAADPYYVLPLIMGISMLIQSKLNPIPPDPIQAKLMQAMPVIFSVVFFFFPAGLVLYSVVNNVLSIAQQWYITRNQQVESAGKK